MSPRRGGDLRDRRKGGQDNARMCTPNVGTPQQPATPNEVPPTQAARAELVIAPLILEADSLTKIKINHLIKNHLPDVKVSNIQNKIVQTHLHCMQMM
ncbi:unnamed protein product [Rotaria socialis]|uniref:Uncharacterized protein n=1 Tax=Rotaria socialis TaxID=392032 RepID=A0A818MUF2_9BILA|nr:unnamed protein product [Rotaria socialis]CAF3594860.1 unnamed protein product [Rotaria socialis]CAF3804292.1 unnamed protein product [Rotaria socialis]CAF4167491.1 unnamed protein product [Rotaria socialis]CAF4261409.1 unnamed protein product [Rotaria socialis]